jgi:hypothetical protein
MYRSDANVSALLSFQTANREAVATQQNKGKEIFRILYVADDITQRRYINSFPQAEAVYESLFRRTLKAGYRHVREDKLEMKKLKKLEKLRITWLQNSWQVWRRFYADREWRPATGNISKFDFEEKKNKIS